jgi:hypothetical protein
MTDKRIVMTTAGSVDEARRIAESLVDRKLAACVNIVRRIDLPLERESGRGRGMVAVGENRRPF